MSEEEYMECSVVAYPRQIKFLHINGSAISYYVDRHVSDYVDRLQKENQELKRQLHEASIQIQELIEKDIWCPSNCEKLKKLQQENKKQKEVIDKIMNLIKQYGKYDGKKCTRGFQMWSADFNKILDMLKEVE